MKRQRWEYEPAVDSASKYWDKGVEGKRKRTVNKASYAEEDARSDSEDDPEELFQPQREEESSSESDNVPIAKKVVSLSFPPPPALPLIPFIETFTHAFALLRRKLLRKAAHQKKAARQQTCQRKKWGLRQ